MTSRSLPPQTSIATTGTVATALPISTRARLTMVAMGYISFLNVVMIMLLAGLPAMTSLPRWTSLSAVAWLLLVPPIVVRTVLALAPLPSGDVAIGSPAFLRWWFTSQWQVIFNRLPWIEECVRLVPGLYSAWLRLWGARVGPFVYWTPGLRILDRPLVKVGGRVVFGADVRISPHIVMPNDTGQLVLRIGQVRIGNDALIGGYSILLAGCWVGNGEATPGKREVRPFSGWVGGKRVYDEERAAHD